MIIPYPLQDAHTIEHGLAEAAGLIHTAKPVSYTSAFVPDACYVSLGASNKLEQNANLINCQQDGIKVFKRQSGGEAVFLSPNCVVFSKVLVAYSLPASADFFANNLVFISSVLLSSGVKDVQRKGISDLTIGDRKILGCAIYRRTHFLLFQAVLNVCENPELIERYLLPPQQEPEYRQARSHSQFVTSLHQQGYPLSPQQIVASLLS